MTTLQLSQNAEIVLKTRYLLGDETPEDLFWRVARAVAQPEVHTEPWAQTFFDMMASCQFMPNSPTLFNAGTGQGTLSACFVIPVEDTMESIMKAATTSAMIQKFGGGIGYAFSKLRSRGSHITTTHGKACGSVSVLKMLSALSDMITQGGKRHGANMGILHVSHPEILDFIHMKDDNQIAQNFNVSVAITDDFMRAVDMGADWDLIDPNSKDIVSTIPARTIWDDIIDSAWQTGDPGLYFIDEANRDNPTPHIGDLDSTNPCGEVPLLPFEACNLGSINLAKFTNDSGFNIDGLTQVTRTATRFLDNVVTINSFPIQEVKSAVDKTRKIGLGIMGWHDALVKLNVPFDSPKAMELADTVMGTINNVARDTSIELARERGPYPECREAIPIRNATRTCIAPTGSISVIAGASSGIEPIYALAFVKNVLDGKQLREVNPYFEQIAKQRGFYSEDLVAEIARTGSAQNIAEVPDDVKDLFKTSLEIDYQTHVNMQAIFQKHTDLAVSKTINMPNTATKDDIEQAYRTAYSTRCKGITIYRDGSKPTQVLEIQSQKPTAETADTISKRGLKPRVRPREMMGVTERVRTGHGNMYVSINFDDANKPFEVFSTLGKAGGCESASLEAISRLISLALRSGVDPKTISEQVRGITCVPAWDEGVLVGSPADAVALAMERHITGSARGEGWGGYAAQLRLATETKEMTGPTLHGNGNGNGSNASHNHGAGVRCPDCNTELIFQESCLSCLSCGWNRCG
ncbi:adenosylcobalamin-dependent ribonucleoside-diphosphate reductase [SAR202 cluster bacterium AD-804-J14_MRT_500m]|nr:adenosylcobalamin-dependent ribonucleoside-diphosphate reductase [SAR202 cluster bacterium AD-804-J14_MRT_500m]